MLMTFVKLACRLGLLGAPLRAAARLERGLGDLARSFVFAACAISNLFGSVLSNDVLRKGRIGVSRLVLWALVPL